MGVTKTVIQEGNGPSPQPGQKIGMLYEGFLKDPSQPGNKGKKYAKTCRLEHSPQQIY
jgi:FK506-binding protein 1